MRYLALLFCFFTCIQPVSSQGLEWRTSELCKDCTPRVSLFTDSLNGIIYTAPIHLFSPVTVYRTSDGGDSWHNANYQDAVIFSGVELQDRVSFLDPSTLFWRDFNYLYFSVDTGATWEATFMSPSPKALRMFTLSNGICIRSFQGTQFEVQLRESEDGGSDWDILRGNLYYSNYVTQDAEFFSESEVLALNSYNGVEIRRTTDQGETWTIVLQDGSMTMPRLERLPGSDIVFAESYPNSPLSISTDRGASWVRTASPENKYIYRTRISLIPDQPLILWAAAGDVEGSIPHDLLSPKVENAFATSILQSIDTGKTWRSIAIPNLPQDARIADIIPNKRSIHVLFYSDTTTYISKAEIQDVSDVRTVDTGEQNGIQVYPNPVRRDEVITITSAKSGPSSEGDITIFDPLGRVVYRSSSSQPLTVRIDTPGTYSIRVIGNDETIRFHRFSVY